MDQDRVNWWPVVRIALKNVTNDYFELVNTPLIQTTVGELCSNSSAHYLNLNVSG
jgi:hypothetical protein